MSFNIIGDIAGQFKTLQALLAKMPEGTPISVGDMIDRGPQSKEVLEFFREGERFAIKGNHEDLFIDFVKNQGRYYQGCWLDNGGEATAKQFQDSVGFCDIPVDLIEWVENLPESMVITTPSDNGLWETCIISHAPLHYDESLSLQLPLDYGILWNRDETSVKPKQRQFQLFGHNSHWDGRVFMAGVVPYAQCLDTGQKMLIGMHWPSMVLYEQEFI